MPLTEKEIAKKAEKQALKAFERLRSAEVAKEEKPIKAKE